MADKKKRMPIQRKGNLPSARQRRLEEEYENDFAPTVEKTASAASTTGRRRSERAAVVQDRRTGESVGMSRYQVQHGLEATRRSEININPMPNLPSSGAGRGGKNNKADGPVTYIPIKQGFSFRGYEYTPNTAETAFETEEAPRRRDFHGMVYPIGSRIKTIGQSRYPNR